jgi:hypothetical protein
MVDATRNFATANAATQRKTLAIGRKPQVRHAFGIVDDVFAQQILPREDLIVGFDLDPKTETFGSIARQVGATCAASLTVVTHEPSSVPTLGRALGRRARRALRPSV